MRIGERLAFDLSVLSGQVVDWKVCGGSGRAFHGEHVTCDTGPKQRSPGSVRVGNNIGKSVGARLY